jgi:hypothetical protein
MRLLKAFAWLRWRVLMNSIERSGARDRLERFSVALEQLGPIVALLLLVPSALLMAAAGAYSGWALAQGAAQPLPFEALRFVLLAGSVLAVVGPIMLPAGDRTNPVRLLLLPISRRMLYTAQTLTTLTDPWLLLIVPVVLSLPGGLAAGGAPAAAIVALAGGIGLLAVLLGLSSFTTSLVHLIVRDRRRGELLTLVFVVLIPFLAMLPALMTGAVGGRGDDARARVRGIPGWITTLERRVLPMVPSELYVRSVRNAAAGRTASSAGALLGLVGAAGVLHGAGFLVFGRMLDSPASSGGARRKGHATTGRWRIPAVSRGTSAVAINQVRLALRTPRGRSILLSPIVVFGLFGTMMWRGGSQAEFGFITLNGGLSLAIFGSFISVLGVLPFAMNQFATDRAGLTLAFLSPLDDRDLLMGKAIGNGVVAAVPALLCTAGAAAAFPGGPVAAWLSVLLGLAASYALVAPLAAILSAIFPRAVDLNSIGNGSNAHGAAGLIGFLAFAAAGALSLVVAIVVNRMLQSAPALLLIMIVWCGICVGAAHLLFVPARAILARRRENLALL